MSLLAELLSTVFDRSTGIPLIGKPDTRPLEELATALVNATGESTSLSLASQILTRFETLDDTDKLVFFRHLAHRMNIDPVQVRQTLDAYEANPSQSSYRAFATAVEPQRQELIRSLNQVPGATAQLVRMRADLLRLGRDEPELAALDLDFRHLFVSWFNRGFLVLRPISWQSPAHVLEKIIAYEAVHTIDSWDDLRRRLQPSDRRCFAFFHPSMPDEPLIFVEVALTQGVPGSIRNLLAEDRDPLASDQADTAVFYSISNCQAGLASISFGNSLIKQVAADLATELSGLKTFVTLSPIPGLMGWLTETHPDADIAAPETLRMLAAFYLLNARGGRDLPRDPVARFHLDNGAIVHALHADADSSDKAMRQSGGVMVNYLYNLRRVEQNHERYVSAGTVAASSEVKSLATAAAKTLI